MYKRSIVINAEEGLHARPAGAFAKKAAEFKDTKITVKKDEKEANAKSIMSILGLGASSGTEITIEAEGMEEEAAVEALCNILS